MGVLSSVSARARALARSEPGLLALMAARVLQLGGAFAVSVCIVWRYGLPSAGLYALAALPAALGALAISLGLPNSLPRAPVSDAARSTLGLAVTSAMLVPVAVGCALYGLCVGRDPGEALSVASLAVAGALLGQVNVQQILYVIHRKPLLAPVAPAIHVAGTFLAVLCPTFEGFALALLAARAAGCAAGFVGLPYGRVGAGDVASAAGSGSRFAPIDLAALLSEQLPVLLLSGFLTRAELGVYGLVRQFVAVADTPGWSFVLSRYPAMVEDPRGSAASIAPANVRLGAACGLATLALASAMSLAVYRVPALVPLLPLALLPMPLRYDGNFCDQALRAAGLPWDSLVLAVAKVALSLTLFAALAGTAGLTGAVLALALVSAAAGIAYRRRFLARFPGSLPPIWARGPAANDA